MEVVALFFLLMELVFCLPRINSLPVEQPDPFPFYLMKTYSQNDTQFDLSSKNISNVPANTFQSFRALEILDLSQNSLTYNSLPCGSLTIATLRHLNTASNQLTTVPTCLPAALEFLDLSKNIIQQVEFSEFTDLHNLNVLLLSHNKIAEILSSGTVLPQLASLDLSYNNFTKLQWKFQMPNLTMLRLEGNPLQQINPYEFSLFPKLHYLNLSMTSLEACSYKAFASEMENLKVLDLSANLFKTFDSEWFEGLNNLQVLWMRHMPFLQSLPADLFVQTPSLIHVDLEENPQLHFVKSSMFEYLLHLEFLSLKSCNLTDFKPWKFFTNSTVTISLSGNPLVCSCELTWLINEPEKVLLNRANDTRCSKNGPQREILLSDLIDECGINGNQIQELQVDASTVQTQLLEHTTAAFHNSSGITIKTSSSKLQVQSSTRFQFSISTLSTKSTTLLNALSFHGLSSDSNSGSLQTKETTTQNDQNWTESKPPPSVKTSTTLSTTTSDQTGSEHYPTTASDQTGSNHYPTTASDQTGSNHYPTTTSDQTGTDRYPTTASDQTGSNHYPTTTSDQTGTDRYPTTASNQTGSNHYPTTTSNQTGSNHYPTTTSNQTGSNHYPTTASDQTGSNHYPITASDQTGSNHYPTTTSDQTGSNHYPTTTSDQTGTNHYPTTASNQTGTNHYPTTTSDQTGSNHYPTTTSDQTGTDRYPTTASNQTGSNHYPTTTSNQTGSNHYPTTTSNQTGSNHYPTTASDQTGSNHYPITASDQTGSNHYPTTTSDQTGSNHYPTTTSDQTGTNHYPTTASNQTGTNHYPTTASNQTGTNHYPTTASDQTGTNHYPTTASNQTGTNHYPTTASNQTGTNHYPTTASDQTGTNHYPTVTLETSTLPEFSSIPTIIKKKAPIFIVIEDDDLESLKEEENTRPTQVGDCNYDPCRHWQVLCRDLQHLTGCHCPDITGEDVIPDPVKILKVIKISDNSAEIYWCSPSSTVLYYYIIYQSDDNRHLYKTDTINPTYRRYTLRDLTSDSTYHTCVVAVNKAGSSTASSIWPSKGPCYIFKTKPNYNNIFYIVSTAIIAILFILVIMLSVCLCRIRQKGRLTALSRISLDPLSLQNPAFDDHLEQADPRTVSTISVESEQIP
ncbi:uncharacterized protein [Heptranchias perlo]|uniref:uncharacterized protein n=1 Tax=Heptranchias perlo TaxID=212740 RepID=UPI0035599395